MAKEKATITVDRAKLDAARELTGAKSASGVIDEALSRLIAVERLRRDIAAYTAQPPTDAELWLGHMNDSRDQLADDTDWEALYDDGPRSA